ncbi:MAG: molybdopterin-dependent oxidoreductase, partial [Burkholderiales bacterium]
ADLWLPIKPGTDAALALAMIHVLFEEQLLDRAFVENWSVGADALRERAAAYAPSAASTITGVPAEKIVAAARLFATQRPSSLVLGHGIDAQANGVKTTMAFHALLALTGNIDIPGGNRAPKRLAGFRDDYGIINDPLFRLPRAIEEQVVGSDRFPLWSGPDAWAKTCHNPSLIDAMRTNAPYPVRSLYVSGVNIACTYPGIDETIAALQSLDCLVVATDHMTPTAELADFVLPKTTLLEEEDVFSDPGGPCLTIVQRAVTPRGETRTDIEIAIDLHARLRARGGVDHDVLPWKTHRAYIDYQLEATNVTFEGMRSAGFAAFAFSHQEYETSGFKTPSRKIELSSSILAAHGIDPLPDYSSPGYRVEDSGFDLILLTGIRSMAYHHSRFRDHAWARKMQDAPELRIHPDTARRAGIGVNDWAWVDVRGGARRVFLKAWLTEDVPLNVVATGMGWWFPEMSGADHGALAFNVDAAIPYGPPWDPISGSAEARNVACRIGRADQNAVTALLRSDHSSATHL